MRITTIMGAGAVLLANVAGAQTAISKSDSGCVATGEGRVECKKIISDGNTWVRFNRASMDSAMMKRAILGIELRPTGSKRDTLGVFVESVIPKGPAENAGIVEGDRIAAINGVDLRVGSADVDDPYTNGLAAHRLNREVQKLTPGSRVNLRVYSGGRVRDVQVTAARASDFPHEGGFRIQIGGPGMDFNGAPGMMRIDGGLGGVMLDPAHMKMMMEQRLQPVKGQLMKMRTPAGAAPTTMPLMRMRAPMPPMLLRGRLIRI